MPLQAANPTAAVLAYLAPHVLRHLMLAESGVADSDC
jgi:hypothetical protein